MSPPSHVHPVNPQPPRAPLPVAARVLRRVPVPRGPVGVGIVCVGAISAISAAWANVVVGAQVEGALGPHRTAWTVVGLLVGGVAIVAFKCHTMLAGHAEEPPPREPPLGGA